MIHPTDIVRLAAEAPLGEGYRLVLPARDEIGELVSCIAKWIPDIRVGGASCFLSEEFYRNQVIFPDAPDRRTLVVLLKQGDELAGMFSCEFDFSAQSVYAALCAAAPEHRGSHLAYAGITFTEAIARHMGAGFIYGMATMRSPHVQSAFERAGWQLTGIMPGYDRELVAPGVVKRVFEAFYCKVLVTDAEMLYPQRGNMTPKTESLFDWVLSARGPRT
jgi:hypothetical protein